MLASLLAAGMPLGAQNLGSEYRLKRVIPVEGRQGVAADSNFYYVSGSTALYKYDKQGRLAAKNERPFEGLPLAANHIGDIDVWDGEIYAGIETFDDGRGENIQVAVYDANTLKWKRSIDWEPSSGQVEVCGLAVDRDGDMVWMADWVDGRYVYGYNRKTGRYVRKVHLRPVPQWQQGIFMVGGRMLISADDGDADLDEPDNLYVADLRDGKSYATVLPFRSMDCFMASMYRLYSVSSFVFSRSNLCSSTVGANSSRSDFAQCTASVNSLAGLSMHFSPPKPQ